MKLEVGKSGLYIIPESEQDEAYIADTLGLRGEGDSIPLRWVSVSGLKYSLAYLGAKREAAERGGTMLSDYWRCRWLNCPRLKSA